MIDAPCRDGQPSREPGPPCSRVVGLLLDYLEDRLSAPTRAALERHLAACPRCEAQVNTYRSTVDLLRSISEHDLPVELRSTLTEFLSSRIRH